MVDSGVVYTALKLHVPMLCDMGPYEVISSSQAPDFKAMVLLADMWRSLLKISPTGEIHCQPMRSAMLSLLIQKPELNKTENSGQVWVGLRVERLTCLLTHLRKIKREGSAALEKAAAKLSRDEFQQLQAGLQLLTLKDEGLDKPSSAQQDLGKSEPGKSNDLEKSPRKKLKKHDSDDVSLNSFGLPRMFDSPEDSKKKPGKVSSSSTGPVGLEKPSSSLAVVAFEPELVSRRRSGSRVPEKKEDLADLLGYSADPAKEKKKKKKGKRKLGKAAKAGAEASEAEVAEPEASPKAKAKAKGKAKADPVPKAKAKAKASPKAKGKAKAKAGSKGKGLAKPVRKPWLAITKTNASNPRRAYLQGRTEAGEKMRLITEVSQKRCPDHFEAIIDEIKESLEKDHLTKEEARDLRESLCSKYGC